MKILIFRNMYKNSHPLQKMKPLYSNTNCALLLARKYCKNIGGLTAYWRV
jgi:hypothetical protein